MRGLSKLASRLVDAVTRNDTAFDTRIADSTTNRLDIPGTYPFNAGRHHLRENGTYISDPANLTDPDAFTDLSGKFQVRATEGDEHIFGARELLRYVPNYELLWGAAVWAESELVDGQHYAIEFSNQDASEGYRYHYAGTADGTTLTLEQIRGGSIVDSVAVDIDELATHGFKPTTPSVARDTLNWYGAGLSSFGLSYPTRDDDGAINDQKNRTIGRTANDGDVATDEINLRIQTRVWVDDGSGAPALTVNFSSAGALVRGNATEFDREKAALFWDVGGSISQYPVDNTADAIAARIDPDRRQVVSNAQPPVFQPAGSGVTMGLEVYAVHKDHPDLSVNFDDPDDDGADEGPSPAAQSRARDDVMQYTRSVSSIPTTTDIRADGTEGLVPDMRNLTGTIGESGQQNTAGATSGGELSTVKRVVFPEDVIVFLPRTDPAGNTTSGRIQFLKALFEEDW